MLIQTIPLSPQAFDPEVVSPPLERTGACLDAPYGARARKQSNFRVTDESVVLCAMAIVGNG